eukprot:gnl/Spiro4/24073_TR11932_c0_g8_i1.p1 gnl/Spiro4/24073_TR11932_c0_g8~~gnl/Spiro4/24073_TR11932_c0_g8_i1.p1  ORF type:complete len:270 (-),score=64.85 gnl/Spiro4/24073_TR11932_c0_g8_i1:153-962(-)
MSTSAACPHPYSPHHNVEVGLGCTLSLIKWFSAGLNFLFLVLGVVVVVVGVNADLGWSSIQVSTDVAKGTIGLGCIIFFLAFLGCFGSAQLKKYILYLYFVLVFLIFIAILVIFVTALMNGDNGVHDTVSKIWDHASNDDRNAIQKSLDCCGFNSVLDRPGSICYSVTTSCADKMHDLAVHYFKILEIVFISVMCVLVFAMISSCCLISGIKMMDKQILAYERMHGSLESGMYQTGGYTTPMAGGYRPPPAHHQGMTLYGQESKLPSAV